MSRVSSGTSAGRARRTGRPRSRSAAAAAAKIASFGERAPQRRGQEHEERTRDAERAGGRSRAYRQARLDRDLLARQEEQEQVPGQANDVAREDDGQHPSRDLAEERQLDQQREHEALVGERIEVGAELRARVRHAGDAAVEPVGHAGGDEEAEGEAEAPVVERDQDRRDRRDSEQSQGVRDVQHGLARQSLLDLPFQLRRDQRRLIRVSPSPASDVEDEPSRWRRATRSDRANGTRNSTAVRTPCEASSSD